jgi:hydroxypyruvate isomerase
MMSLHVGPVAPVPALQQIGRRENCAGINYPLFQRATRMTVQTPQKDNHRIHQSVCRWCFGKIPIEDLARHAPAMGLVGIDMVDVGHWNTLKKYGLLCTMTSSHGIDKGLNDPANHAESVEKIRAAIDATAAAGFANVICFSGNRIPGMSDETAMERCEQAIKNIVGHAERNHVTLCLELLNSKVNHKGYLCDRSDWGAALVKRVGSESFKLLYDIYHMQVQEGDVIATLRKHKDAIGHYHTGGVPGRGEIDEGQELNYPAIMRAIADTGYTGFIAHEFIPTRDPIQSLQEAVKICDV